MVSSRSHTRRLCYVDRKRERQSTLTFTAVLRAALRLHLNRPDVARRVASRQLVWTLARDYQSSPPLVAQLETATAAAIPKTTRPTPSVTPTAIPAFAPRLRPSEPLCLRLCALWVS